MVETKLPAGVHRPLLDRRWIGLMYAAFALVLLALATLQRAETVALLPPALLLLLALVLATALTAMLIGQGHAPRLSTVLLLVDAVAALGLIALTGGYASPLWVGLLLVSTAAPLLLPGRRAATLLTLVWLAYGSFLFATPAATLAATALAWALRVAGVGLIALVLHRAIAAEAELRKRVQRRERVLHEFLQLSAHLRVSSQPQNILEEVARTVQASGDFDCVTLSQVDRQAGIISVVVSFGASGRRLTAVEGLAFPWSRVAALLNDQCRVGPGSFRLETLPFRSIRNEQHLVLLLSGQSDQIHGLLTVSCPTLQAGMLEEAQPLLELLANQAASVLDNSDLYALLERRMADATATAKQRGDDLAVAHYQAETLYQILRALTRTLDERAVLDEALALVQQATGAEWGGVLLLEPNTGRLAVRCGCEGLFAGDFARLHELAGVAVATRTLLDIPDTARDGRWPPGAAALRALLVVPLLLDNEPLGALVLGDRRVKAFMPAQTQLAQAVGDQIAVALSKAQLYRYVSEQSEQLGHTLKQREEEISRIQAILSSIGEGVVVCDRLDRVRLINPAAVDLLGIGTDNFIGRPMADLPGVSQGQHSEGQHSFEDVGLGARTLRAHYAPVLATSGDQLGSVVVYHDVTRDVMADKLKSSFIATASHELRTPLTSIRGYVDLLLLGTIGPLSQPQCDFLTVVKHNVVQLVELIDDILDVSKVEAGEVRLRRTLLDAGALLHEVAESMYSQFAEKSIALAIDIAPDLPRFMADRQRVRQVAVNLISNACKYTPVGGTVDVVARAVGDELRIDVRDTGVGIAVESQAYIFTPFYRADNPLRDAAGGTGLGLSITKTLIELHGGRIWFESTEGQGTTFSFTLPLHGYEWSEPAWLEAGVKG